ncbi:hypothetical protein FH609_007600 [Streptomyces sp. 3MP-14]|uniref:Lipoprotein n=1 Tax=Streptomyces mimosae TaxID=2586635 RepID=A0A5N6AL01_9ACTN|nr:MULTISPECIES: hypothetical protein [Streptomyces]KAB8168733.1 hypothetical protein FH607_005765 [Streptomyces mimosae]KAB8177987.1 hypothetical protein FH609_007600 [Streptomyces sp. 3MP-14]
MRTKMIVPTVAVAGLLLAGCGSESGDTSEGAEPEDPAASAPEDPGDGGAGDEEPDDDDGTDGGQAGGGQQAADAAFDARADEVAASWPEPPAPAEPNDQLATLHGMLPAEPGSEELTVHVPHGQCDADFGAWVAETDELVIVGGWIEPDPTVDACVEILLVDEVPVALDSELGGRTVVDAVSGQELTVHDEG